MNEMPCVLGAFAHLDLFQYGYEHGSGEWLDLNPSSSTYWLCDFGQVT